MLLKLRLITKSATSEKKAKKEIHFLLIGLKKKKKTKGKRKLKETERKWRNLFFSWWDSVWWVALPLCLTHSLSLSHFPRLTTFERINGFSGESQLLKISDFNEMKKMVKILHLGELKVDEPWLTNVLIKNIICYILFNYILMDLRLPNANVKNWHNLLSDLQFHHAVQPIYNTYFFDKD